MLSKRALKRMIENRDEKIEELCMSIEYLKEVIESMQEDLDAIRQEAYKTAKKPATRKKTK